MTKGDGSGRAEYSQLMSQSNYGASGTDYTSKAIAYRLASKRISS